MGMFDWYVPVPPLACPKCGVALDGWQGKGGPCALFEWVQGSRVPVRQLIDDDAAISESDRNAVRLPQDFEIHTSCASCQAWIRACGWCEADTWSHVAFLNPLEPPGLSNDWMLLSDEDRLHVLAELRREIPSGHVLHARRIAPLARRRDGDDVLVRTLGGADPLYILRLTWRFGSDPASPRVQAFRDLAAIAESEL